MHPTGGVDLGRGVTDVPGDWLKISQLAQCITVQRKGLRVFKNLSWQGRYSGCRPSSSPSLLPVFAISILVHVVRGPVLVGAGRPPLFPD